MVNINLNFFRWRPKEPDATSGPSFVFLHGMGGTGQIWRPIAAQLEDEFDCIAPDQRGHGLSRPLPKGEAHAFHADDYARDVLGLLNRLSLKRIILVGHSMGVRTALALARMAPDRIQALTAVDIGISSEWGGGMGIPLAEFLKNLPSSFPDRARLKAYLQAHCPDPAIAQYLGAVARPADQPETDWQFPFDHSALLQTIEQAHQAPLGEWLVEILNEGVPVTFLRGALSKVWLKHDYEDQKIRFSHPRLRFEEWEGCGHGLPFEKRDQFCRHLKDQAQSN